MTTKYAFPCPPGGYLGMTLRDYFAGQALIGAAISKESFREQYLAERAYAIADAMLEIRDKFPSGDASE